MAGTEKRQRPKLVQVRVSDEERIRIQEAADRVGLTVGSYARERLLAGGASRAVRRPPIDRAKVSEVLAALGPIGTDVRAIRDVLRTGAAEGSNVVSLDQAEAAFDAILKMRDALMRALGRDP
jgi:hypothetical protein